MKYKFSDIDYELITIQLENQIYSKSKLLKKENFKTQKIKHSVLDYVIKFITDKKLINTSKLYKSKDFYEDTDFVIEYSYDEYEFNGKSIQKDDILNLFLEQLDIYYLIYRLPKFNVSHERISDYLYILYDYITTNKKGNFSSIITSINRFVLADALINKKDEINYSNYIQKLKYLSLFGFSYREINKVKKILESENIINFDKHKQKKI